MAFALKAATGPHPIVNFIEAERVRRGMNRRALLEDVGLGVNLINFWLTGTEPGLMKIENLLHTLGYKLAVVPLDEPVQNED